MVRDNLPKQFGEPTCDIKANIHKYNIASVPRHTTPLSTLLPRREDCPNSRPYSSSNTQGGKKANIPNIPHSNISRLLTSRPANKYERR